MCVAEFDGECESIESISSHVNITSVCAGSDGAKGNTSMELNAVENCISTYSSAFCIHNLTSLDVTQLKEGTGGLLTVNGECFIPGDLSYTVTIDNSTITLESSCTDCERG